jgi:ribonuclease HII
MSRVAATRTLENALRKLGFNRVCGVDEVGRGCLAGPVVAGAVVLHPDRHIRWLSDSKKVPPAEREDLFDEITARAVAWAVAEATPGEIDAINIHQASLQAMRRAVLLLAPLPEWFWWMRSASRICSWPSGASCTATSAVPPSRPRR